MRTRTKGLKIRRTGKGHGVCRDANRLLRDAPRASSSRQAGAPRFSTHFRLEIRPAPARNLRWVHRTPGRSQHRGGSGPEPAELERASRHPRNRPIRRLKKNVRRGQQRSRRVGRGSVRRDGAARVTRSPARKDGGHWRVCARPRRQQLPRRCPLEGSPGPARRRRENRCWCARSRAGRAAIPPPLPFCFRQDCSRAAARLHAKSSGRPAGGCSPYSPARGKPPAEPGRALGPLP